MSYMLTSIPVDIEKYILTGKEIAKFFSRKQRWFSYAERIPKHGEMIHLNTKKTEVIGYGDENYIRNCYTDAAKNYYKYVVLARRNNYNMIYKPIIVNE